MEFMDAVQKQVVSREGGKRSLLSVRDRVNACDGTRSKGFLCSNGNGHGAVTGR